MQKIIAMQPKLPKNNHFSGENNHFYAKKGQLSEMSLDVENPGQKRKKTESITFRLESAILLSLRQEAKRKDVSVNTLVSQIARQHTNWHSSATQAGFMYVRRPLIAKLIDGQNEEQIKSLARHVALSSNKDFILMLRSKYDIYSALDIIETWIRISGYSYSHNTRRLNYSDMLHYFILQHNMGMKWSLYLSELYKNLFEEFGIRNSQFDMTDSTLTFQIVVPLDGKEEKDPLNGNNENNYHDR
jgi:predicted DNA-binding ribbon-helix-helix protein